MPFDDEGNLVNQAADAVATESNPGTVAPPGYGEHMLDQLFADIDTTGFHSPLIQSGLNTPYYSRAHSRAGSVENLSGFAGPDGAAAAAALSSRLQSMSQLDAAQRNSSYFSLRSGSSAAPSAVASRRQSTVLSRSSSREEGASAPSTGRTSPEHVDYAATEVAELSKVPSYATAVRTPVRPRSIFADGIALPDYEAATSAPPSPAGSDVGDPLATIVEVPSIRVAPPPPPPMLARSPSTASSSGSSSGASLSARLAAGPTLRPRTTRSRPSSISSFLMLQRMDSHPERRRFSWVSSRA